MTIRPQQQFTVKHVYFIKRNRPYFYTIIYIIHFPPIIRFNSSSSLVNFLVGGIDDFSALVLVVAGGTSSRGKAERMGIDWGNVAVFGAG